MSLNLPLGNLPPNSPGKLTAWVGILLLFLMFFSGNFHLRVIAPIGIILFFGMAMWTDEYYSDKLLASPHDYPDMLCMMVPRQRAKWTLLMFAAACFVMSLLLNVDFLAGLLPHFPLK